MLRKMMKITKMCLESLMGPVSGDAIFMLFTQPLSPATEQSDERLKLTTRLSNKSWVGLNKVP